MKTQNSSLEFHHFPVMLNEVIQVLSPIEGGLFVDCTFGAGGYSRAILNFSNTKVIAFDRDSNAIFFAKKLENQFQNRFNFNQLRFSQMSTILNNINVDAIVFDLGLSSVQLRDLSRGFSFNSKDKLDMTMGLTDKSAQDAVNNLSEKQLKIIIKILGEEKEASKIAKNIVKARLKKKITRVDELTRIIEKTKKKSYPKKINPCTKTFQALRIFVNKEFTELLYGIANATKFLKPGGKILVVSFHSIEDKIVKYFFNNFSKSKANPSRYLPEENNDKYALFEKYRNKVIRPSKKEITKNNPSRSAKLRVAIRSKNKFVNPEFLFQKFEKYLEIEGYNV